MKIAVASKNEIVSEHFGHCEGFNFFELENGKVLSENYVASPGHSCKGLPIFLKENGVEVLISGGIGRGAKQNLENLSIEVISGASGLAKEAALSFERGQLKSDNVLCSHDHGQGHHHH